MANKLKLVVSQEAGIVDWHRERVRRNCELMQEIVDKGKMTQEERAEIRRLRREVIESKCEIRKNACEQPPE